MIAQRPVVFTLVCLAVLGGRAHVVHAAACRQMAVAAAVDKMDALWREAQEIRRQHEN